MTPIEPLQLESMSREIPISTTISLTFFIGLGLCGLYVYDMFKRVKHTESSMKELTEKINDTVEHQESQEETLHEYDQRIREKKDFDELEEIEEGKYQAWSGFLDTPESNISLTIKIWREKISTVKKNLDWTNWDKTEDSSCIVRDFYLGNSNPDFSWIVCPSQGDSILAEMKDTLVNGWDSVCKIHIVVTSDKKNLLEFLSKQEFQGSATLNLLLKKCIDDKLIRWSRILLDA